MGWTTESLISDVRYAVRALVRQPRNTLVVVATLGLALGATVAIYTVLKTVLVSKLPYTNVDHLVTLDESSPTTRDAVQIDYTFASTLASHSRSIESLSAYTDTLTGMNQGGEPLVLRGLRVSYDFFDTLGVQMYRGRTFSRDEDQPGRRSAVILSYGLWQDRFGGDSTIIGRSMAFDDSSVQVIGVLGPEFRPLIRATSELSPEYYVTLGMNPLLSCHNCQPVRAIAKLRTGVTVAQARQEINSLGRQLIDREPAAHLAKAEVRVITIYDHLLGHVRAPMIAITWAVLLVLLVACANVANLTLARAIDRKKEMAIRASLGAGRGRTITQLTTETLVLSLTAGGFGILLALASMRALIVLAPVEIPRIGDAHIDLGVAAFAIVTSLGAGFLCSLIPGIWVVNSDPGEALKGPDRGAIRSAQSKILSTVVVAELALAFVLTASAGLLVKSFVALINVDPGYDPKNVLTLTTRLWSKKYSSVDDAQEYYRQALERVRALPGVESAAFTSIIPMDYSVQMLVRSDVAETPQLINFSSVSADYFKVMRIPVMAGRTFTDADTRNTPDEVVLSAACARLLFGVAPPIGKRVKIQSPMKNHDPWRTVIGVVGDVRQDGLERTPSPQFYLSQNQELRNRFYRLVARTRSDPVQMRKAVESAFASIDRSQPVYHIKPLDAYLAGTTAERSFSLTLITGFGVVSLLLAAVGVYGVTSYSVTRRVREIGVRIAIGARPRDILWMLLRDASVLTVMAISAGMGLTLLATRTLRSMLFGVQPGDAAALVGATCLTVFVVMIATLPPARRAGKVDPVICLRDE